MANKDFSVEALMDLSLDDYIKVKNIHRSDHDPYKMANSRSKFDRFRDVEDTASEDEVDGGITSLAADDIKMEDCNDTLAKPASSTAAPATVWKSAPSALPQTIQTFNKPHRNKVWTNVAVDNGGQSNNRGSVHDRLGNKGNQFNVRKRHHSHNPYYKNNMEANRVRNLQFSVQNRLKDDYVNLAQATKNIQTLAQAFGANGSFDFVQNITGKIIEGVKKFHDDKDQGQVMKYDMDIQKDISTLQKKPLFFKCPGGAVVSSDGQGIDDRILLKEAGTGMTLNQRFA